MVTSERFEHSAAFCYPGEEPRVRASFLGAGAAPRLQDLFASTARPIPSCG